MLEISINLWSNAKIIFSNIDKYCGYNEYKDNITYISSVKEGENKRMDEKRVA
jgi:hypothetical protein